MRVVACKMGTIFLLPWAILLGLEVGEVHVLARAI